MLASTFLTGGVNALRNADQLAQRAEPVTARLAPAVERTTTLPIPLDSKQLVQLNAVVQIVGGAMLASGRAPRLSALVLAGSVVPTTLAGHRFWAESDPQQRRTERIQFFKNVSMAGGLLIASVDTGGKPSLAWRAQRQAGKARKQAVKATRQAAKLTSG